jgi:hypothetical protein
MLLGKLRQEDKDNKKILFLESIVDAKCGGI